MSTLPNNKKIHIIGGGTNSYIANHLALSAPAYGGTAKQLFQLLTYHPDNKMDVQLHLTKMAGGKDLDTPEDVSALVDTLIADPDTRVIIFNAAIVDYKPVMAYGKENGTISAKLTYRADGDKEFGKYVRRISTSESKSLTLLMTPTEKIINKIRKQRKDILLVSFKTTCGADKEEQFNKGLKLCKYASANIVFVNDVDKNRINNLNNLLKEKENLESILPLQHSIYININTIEKEIQALQNNGLVTPEESSYWYNTRNDALSALVDMVLLRTNLHFTRSTVIDAVPVSWQDAAIPATFRAIVEHCITEGAYKSFGQSKSTVGHMGLKINDNEFLTTIRKSNFNDLKNIGLVRVITDDPDNVFGYKHWFEEDSSKQKVIAFGNKPSVGGQSQRTLFDTYPDLNAIVHFHCALRPEFKDVFKPTQQFPFECGSKECINSNITGFKEFKVSDTFSIWAGHMDHHGPNIIFNSEIDPQLVIDFIQKYWNLQIKTDGLSLDRV